MTAPNPFGTIIPMNTITNTACYTAFISHERRDDLLTEIKVQSGENPQNLEFRLYEGKEIINFTITLIEEEEDDMPTLFDQIGRDISRFLGVEVVLDDVLIDD